MDGYKQRRAYIGTQGMTIYLFILWSHCCPESPAVEKHCSGAIWGRLLEHFTWHYVNIAGIKAPHGRMMAVQLWCVENLELLHHSQLHIGTWLKSLAKCQSQISVISVLHYDNNNNDNNIM